MPQKAAAAKDRAIAEKAKATLAAEPDNDQIEPEPEPFGAAPAAKAAALAKAEAPAADRLGGASDPVTSRAKITIAAKLEDPDVEFLEMKRAVRENTLGEPIDTICGRVKGKTLADAQVREMPFLYFVKEDDVYIVNGGADAIAVAAYGNICLR